VPGRKEVNKQGSPARRWALLILAVLVLGGFGDVSLASVSPELDGPSAPDHLGATVLGMVMGEGIAQMILVVAALVSLPWVIAGLALTAMSFPRLLHPRHR
jgi:hypothetical protein